MFRSTRASLVKQHNALKFITKSKILLKHVLFPEKIGDAPLRPQVDVRVNDNGDIQSGNRLLKLFNPALNDVQKSAVVNVLQGRARPLPYVIFGPPGTGKTSAIVEIIQQIYTNVRGSRLLIATPSNSAANLITQRLIDSGALIEGDFVRICGHNALSRGLISESLEPYCALIDIAAVGTGSEEIWNYSDRVKTYNSREIRAQRVLIGTCNALGTLLHLNLPANHFTHVIVDEAGQCMEPEIVIPMSRVSERCGQIILAGDPMQLGPIVLSRLAKARGLDKSFLVRLLEQSPYGRDLDVSLKLDNYYPPTTCSTGMIFPAISSFKRIRSTPGDQATIQLSIPTDNPIVLQSSFLWEWIDSDDQRDGEQRSETSQYFDCRKRIKTERNTESWHLFPCHSRCRRAIQQLAVLV